MSRDYRIASFRLRVHPPCDDIAGAGVSGFAKFEVDCDPTAECVAEFRLDRRLSLSDFRIEALHRFDFADADSDCLFGRTDDGFIFHMRPHGCTDDSRTTIFIKRHGGNLVESNIAADGAPDPTLLRFGLWIMFGLAVNPLQAAAVHSSVIVKDGGAVIFLGESGTGKSTHTRLWREHIDEARLLNDDSPIVRIIDGQPVVCGSPWSGKTPCYINKCYPLRGVVRLSQAPHNRMRRLSLFEAFGALYPSCPPSFAYDSELQSNVSSMIAAIVGSVGVWHLECLPDGDAARLAYETIFGDQIHPIS